MSGFKVLQPGLLTLIQDAGRFGQHRIGLTNGGPLDSFAFYWANRLCQNEHNNSVLEISIGGLVLEAQTNTYVALCGAEMPFKINGTLVENWRTHKIKTGDKLDIGFASSGSRAYLAVANGFCISHSFTSSSTVVREKIGGLDGDKLKKDDFLNCTPSENSELYSLPDSEIPNYPSHQTLRVILGYQKDSFSKVQKQLFFSSEYQLSDQVDRMGFRLQGQKITSSLNGILSEGICHGAIQVPADGQPIVLMNDRQTIGGYPKIGSVIALDTAKLSQLMPKSTVNFEEITIDQAHNINHLSKQRLNRIGLIKIS